VILSNIIVIISSPSGCGKTSISQELLKKNKNLVSTISYTTRTPRKKEQHGKDYYFISLKKFKKLKDKNFFLEYAKIFNDYYATSKSELVNLLTKGHNILLPINWQGAKKIYCMFPKASITIFLLPPSKKELFNRLKKRGQDSEKIIHQRMEALQDEISHFQEFDYTLVNKCFQKTCQNIQYIIESELNKTYRSIILKKKFLLKLLS